MRALAGTTRRGGIKMNQNEFPNIQDAKDVKNKKHMTMRPVRVWNKFSALKEDEENVNDDRDDNDDLARSADHGCAKQRLMKTASLAGPSLDRLTEVQSRPFSDKLLLSEDVGLPFSAMAHKTMEAHKTTQATHVHGRGSRQSTTNAFSGCPKREGSQKVCTVGHHACCGIGVTGAMGVPSEEAPAETQRRPTWNCSRCEVPNDG